MARESGPAAELRWAKLAVLQKHYASFNVFMDDCMEAMGFKSTWMQHDIAAYLQYGPEYLMIQAQRGQAKTTITACYAVFCLIHDPRHRVLIVSAGGKQANEISTLIQRLILTIDTLECLRPDANNGDRTSVEAFDVHYTLKGIDKSPSVACIGITGNLPGKRADLLIADDIESPKNSMTAVNRSQLLALSLEFSSICTTGRIVYLGTPQTSDSIYNTLPGRGFSVRIWPGRFPTPAERKNYGNFLAPALVSKMDKDPSLCFGGGVAGDMGQPTDPVILDEEGQQRKLLDKGASSYQLQYMLNTRLMDSLRFPLKLENLIVMKRSGDRFPMVVTRGFGAASLRSFNSSGMSFNLMSPHAISEETEELQGKHCQIDPAGGGVNGDETAFACTGFLNGNVYILKAGGVRGGYELPQLTKLAEIVAEQNPNTLSIEKNMGHGAFAKIFLPVLRGKGWKGNVIEEFVSGNKEARMIGTIEPVLGRGSLIICENVIEEDDQYTEEYSTSKRVTYSLFHQMSKLTREKKSLAHDDRLDALEGSVRHWMQYLAIDQKAKTEASAAAKLAAFMKDPFQRNRYQPPKTGGKSIFDKYRK